MKNKNLAISAVLAVVAVFLLNFIFYFGFIRFDLTANKIYSLSKASKKIISKFDDYILIRAVFSKTLPEQFKFIRLYVEDILKEYRIYSRGKIKYEFIDPTQPKAKLKESDVYSMGIMPVEFSILQKDKFEVKKGYMGLAMLYKGKKEVIPVVNNVETLEYDITSALKRLTLTERKKIGVLSLHKCDTFSDEEFEQVKDKLNKFYDFKNVEISSDSLKDLDALIVTSPKENFSPFELFLLDQFILLGKPVAFLLPKYNISTQTFFANKIVSNVFDLVSNYGVDVEDGLIVDYQCQKIGITSRQGFIVMQQIVDYPLMPRITKINQTHPLVKDLSQIVMSFCSPISIKQGVENISYSILFETSKYSFVKKDIYSVNPLIFDFTQPKDAKKGPFIVGLELKGKFKSFYFEEDKFKQLNLKDIKDYLKESKDNSRILIFSSSDFIYRQPEFLANIVDYLAQEEDILAIRNKQINLPPLKEINPTLKVAYRYFVTLFPSFLVLFFGIYRWYLRKTKAVVL